MAISGDFLYWIQCGFNPYNQYFTLLQVVFHTLYLSFKYTIDYYTYNWQIVN